jgi:N-acetylmuramoyl-L-alanine amidase
VSAALRDAIARGDRPLLREMLAPDPQRVRPMFPILRVQPDHQQGNGTGKPSSGEILALARQARQARYHARQAEGWTGRRLVSKGDGWMQFPLVSDLVAQLEVDHAVWCLSGEDDALAEGPGQQELAATLVDLRPDALLLGAGGSQLFEPARIRAFLDPAGARDREDPLFSSYLDSYLSQDLLPRFHRLLFQVRRVDARLPVLLHGYAAPVPRAHHWLARLLGELGLEGHAARQAMAALVDRFHAALADRLAQPGWDGVLLVDCRALVGRNWFDEMIPNDRGFAAVADAFRSRLSALP